MAISTYSELKTAVADFLNRDDLTDVIPTFISLTEAKLGRRYKDFTALSGNNPSNWILSSHPDVYLYGALVEASPYLSDDARVAVWGQLYATAVLTLKGTVNNADFDDYSGLILAIGDWMGRADLDGAIPQLIKLAEAKLFRKFDGVSALSYAANTNWILQNHPDLYLYGSLSEASPYIGNDERIQVWKTLYEAEIGRIRKPKSGVNLDNYDGLKAAIADWLERYDLDDAIPDFIRLAEARIMRDMRHWRQQRRVTTTLNESFENLPGDFLQPIHFYIDTDQGEQTLEFSSMGEISRSKKYAAGVAGKPTLYTINSGQIEFIPAPDGDYPLTLIYYARTVALSADQASNWLLTYYPDIYLYGSLMQSASYLKDDQRIMTWERLYFEAVAKANQESDAATYSGPLVLRNK